MNFLWQAALLCCAAVWGATFYLIKDALHGVHPVALVGYRFGLSALFLAPAALLRRREAGEGGGLLKDGAVLAGLLLILYVTQTAGLAWTTASNSGFITGLFVVFVPALLYAARRQVPTPSQRAAVLLAVSGLWLLTGGPRGVNRGDAITLASAFAYAAHLLYTDRCVRAGRDLALLAFHQFWMTGAASLSIAAAMGYPLGVADSKTAWVIVFLAIVPTLSAFFIQMAAQRRIEPMRVSLIFSTEPVFAALFAWTLGGEAFRTLSAAGGGLIAAAMAVSELSPKAETPSAEARVGPAEADP